MNMYTATPAVFRKNYKTARAALFVVDSFI